MACAFLRQPAQILPLRASHTLLSRVGVTVCPGRQLIAVIHRCWQSAGCLLEQVQPQRRFASGKALGLADSVSICNPAEQAQTPRPYAITLTAIGSDVFIVFLYLNQHDLC